MSNAPKDIQEIIDRIKNCEKSKISCGRQCYYPTKCKFLVTIEEYTKFSVYERIQILKNQK